MKLGLVSAILDQSSYEEMIDTAAELGFACVEAACWPQGAAERRYGGVSHIDADRVLEEDAYAAHIRDYAREKEVEISSLAYYPNTMDSNQEKREAAIRHLRKLICASAKLGVNMVTTFIGRDQNKTVEENLELMKEIWPPILKLAEENQVKVAIENCPMLFDQGQWPGGQNLMTTPYIWQKVLRYWTALIWESTMIRPTLFGRGWITLNPSISLKKRSFMSITRILRYMRISWSNVGLWPILSSI